MVEELIDIVLRAGEEVLEVYNTDFSFERKEDLSPVTEADRRSHRVIEEGLSRLTPDIPIISEEGSTEGAGSSTFWLVDPLDGTKEFIKRNGEFTVNVALVKDGKPVMGVVYAPDLGKLYYGEENEGAYLLDVRSGERFSLPLEKRSDDKLRVVVSRSHADERTEEFLERLSEKFRIEKVSVGSSLKLCILAEGRADVYPRTGPTMEWDTAGAHAVLLQTGGTVRLFDCSEELSYGKEGLKNPPFIAFRTRELSKEICP